MNRCDTKRDEEFRAWTRLQPSCISGRFSEWVNGEGMNPACHVRRARTSGVAHKALFSCIPMTHEEHATQHAQGELACLVKHMNARDLAHVIWQAPDQERAAKDWFDAQVERHRAAWGRSQRAE